MVLQEREVEAPHADLALECHSCRNRLQAGIQQFQHRSSFVEDSALG